VNYLPEAQEIALNAKRLKDVKVIREAGDRRGIEKSDKKVKIAIEPLSAVMLSYSTNK